MKTGHYGMKFDEGSAEDKRTAMDSSRALWSVSAHTARDGWPVGEQASLIDENARGSLTVGKLHSRDTQDPRSDIDESLPPPE